MQEQWASDAGCKGVFFHSWPATEFFFACAVLPHLLASAPPTLPLWRTVYLPSQCQWVATPKRQPGIVFKELADIFDGPASRLTIRRHPAVAHCRPSWELPASECCNVARPASNATAMRSLSHTLGAARQMHVAELRPANSVVRSDDLRVAMRAVVWANLGVSSAAVDTALFVSNEGASNGRTIAHESRVVSIGTRMHTRICTCTRMHLHACIHR